MKKSFTKIISAISAVSLMIMPVTVGAAVDFSSEINQNSVLKAGAYAEAGNTNTSMVETLSGALTYTTDEITVQGGTTAKNVYIGQNDFSTTIVTPDNTVDALKSPDGQSNAWLIAPYYRNYSGTHQTRNDHGFGLEIKDGLFDKSETDFTMYIEYWGERTADFTLQYAAQPSPSNFASGHEPLTVRVPLNNPAPSGQWKVAKYEFDNAWFAKLNSTTWGKGGFHGKNQLAIKSNGTVGYIRRVAIVKTSEVENLENPNNIFDIANNKAPRIYTNSVIIDGEPEITTNGIENTVTVNLTNIDFKEGEIKLIASAVDKKTDMITDLTVVSKTVNRNVTTATLSATVDVAEGSELKYYLVDANGGSLNNIAPISVENCKVISTMAGARIKWDKMYDDFGGSYNVYENGKLIAETDQNEYYVNDFKKGETREYQVEAVDHTGAKTPLTETLSAGLFIPSYINFADFSDNGGCSFNNNTTNGSSDSCIKIVTNKGGSTCVQNVDLSTVGTRVGYSYIYVASNPKDVDTSVDDVTIIVEYYGEADDDGAGLTMQYIRNATGRETTTKTAAMSGGDKWNTAVFQVTDADFGTAPAWLSNGDMRFNGSKDGILHLRKVTIMPTEAYVAELFE